MFTPSQVHHSHCRKHCTEYLNDSFDLLCWNVHKKNRTHKAFGGYIEETFGKRPDLMLFQEADFDPSEGCTIEGYSIEAAANLELNGSYYGVLTASRTPAKEARAFLLRHQQIF